jgi:Uma2 family endonuclease
MQEPKPPGGQTLTHAEFVAYAEAREGRFEYVDGRVLDMGIPSDAHQDLVFELGKRIDAHLAGTPCRVRLAGMLRTGKRERSPDRSPDLLVVCDGKPAKLVCEVLSPNRGDDLEDKLTEYQAMPEFEEYLVIDSTKRWVRVHRRNADGLFVVDADHIRGLVRLASLGYTLDIDAVYQAAGILITSPDV